MLLGSRECIFTLPVEVFVKSITAAALNSDILEVFDVIDSSLNLSCVSNRSNCLPLSLRRTVISSVVLDIRDVFFLPLLPTEVGVPPSDDVMRGDDAKDLTEPCGEGGKDVVAMLS